MTLGIYIHVPFCKHECPYCDFYKLALGSRPARARLDFPRRLADELALHLASRPELAQAPLETNYFGGGTPSTLVPQAVGDLVRGIRREFPASATAPEVTLEANPENLTASRCGQWLDAGITRLSIGVQSFHLRDLKLLERLHEPEAITAAVSHARAAGFGNLSLDLMFALPGQSHAEWMENLRRALELHPNHISFYGLTYHEGTAFEAWRRAGRIAACDEDAQAEMYLAGAELLEAAGFEHYEISNFARPGFRSAHNQRYWTRADVLGLGPGAHSNIGAARWRNPDDLDAWQEAIDAGAVACVDVEELADDLAAAEALFTNLRRREGLERAVHRMLCQLCEQWLAAAPAEARAWMTVDAGGVRLTREGWLRADAIVDAVLQSSDGVGPPS